MTNDEIIKQLESLLAHCKSMIEKDDSPSIWEKDCEALEAAIAALRPTNEPLTLEQIQKVPHGKIKDSTLKSICNRANEIAYPSAKIDREKWAAKWIKYDGYTECSSCEYWYDSPEYEDDGDRPAFCPSCGRATTPEAWAELEKRLRSVNHG